MANESILSGELGIRYHAIVGENTDENFTKHFGDMNQYLDSQYEFGESQNPNWGHWSTLVRYSNTFPQLSKGSTLGTDYSMMQNIPTVDGKIIFEHPDFVEFYKKIISPDVLKIYGTNWKVSETTNRIGARIYRNDAEAHPMYVQKLMLSVAPTWMNSSGVINGEKLAKAVSEYKLNPEQERRFKDMSSAEPKKDGQIYSDTNGLYTMIGGTRYNVEEGTQVSGEIDGDGNFVATGAADAGGSVIGIARNGIWKYEGLVYNGTVQLSDGTKVEIPNHATLAHDNSVVDGVGFYNGYFKIDNSSQFGQIATSRLFDKLESNYEVDEDGNILIKATKGLEFIANSPVVGLNGATGYAGLGYQKFVDEGLAKSVNPVTLEEFNGGVESLAEFKYTDFMGRVYALNDKGSVKKADFDVKIDADGDVTYKGKKIGKDGENLFLTQNVDGIHNVWDVQVYNNGTFDLHNTFPNGWVYSVNDSGWFYRSDAKDTDGEPGAEWRWYSTGGSQDNENGIWLYTNDEMLSKDVPQFMTSEEQGGLAVYNTGDGWRSYSTSELLDSNESGTFEDYEILEHAKTQQDTLLDDEIIDQDTYNQRIEDFDQKIENSQPEPAYYEKFEGIDGSGIAQTLDENGNPFGKYSIYDSDGNLLEESMQQPLDIPSKTEYLEATATDTVDTDTADTDTDTGDTDTGEDFSNAVYYKKVKNFGRNKYALYDENYNEIGRTSSRAGYQPLPDTSGDDTSTDTSSQESPTYYESQISAGKTLYNIYSESGKLLSQQDTVPELPSYDEYLADWQSSGGETGWGTETYRRLDLANSEFERLEDGSLRLINPAFTGDPLSGQAALDAANKDAENLARLAATAPGAEAGLSTKMISAGIDKLLGPEWNPIRWLNKLNGAEDMVNISIAYQKAQNAAALTSASNQNLATYVGASRLAGKPWLNPGGTIQEQVAPFLQRKYIVNDTTGELERNALYDPRLSDFIYNKGADGIEGTSDDFEQMWAPSWLLPWDYRQMEAEWRVGYEGALQEQLDYYNKPIYDTDADGVLDQTAYEKKQEEGMDALYDKGFYNDPDQIYTITDENGNIQYVDYKGNAIETPPGAAPPGGYKEYSQSLYDQLADDMYEWEFGDEDSVNSRIGRTKQFNEARDYYNDLNDSLEQLATNTKLKNRARLYNFASDTSPMAEARTDAFNNTAKAVLFGGQGINKNMFNRQAPEEGYDFFGNKKPEADNPYSVAAGGNVFNLQNPNNIGQSAEQVLFNEGFDLPELNKDNIFLKDRKTPTTKTTATGTT
jgi:hypothetical protein